MKVALILKCIMVFGVIHGYAQKKILPPKDSVTNPSHSDTIYLNKKMAEFKVDMCLHGLLDSVVESDKKMANYPSGVYFYLLTFKKGDKLRYMNIKPVPWKNSEFLDYTGVIRVRGSSFLCRGDFESDKIFHKKKANQVKIRLQKPVNTSDEQVFFQEPCLQGQFSLCNGMPIYIEVYSKNKINGFDMSSTENDSKRKP